MSSSGIVSDFEAASNSAVSSAASGVQVTTFTELVDEVPLHFQIIRLTNQVFNFFIYLILISRIYILGNLYAAAPTRPNNTVSVTSILGGASDKTASGITRRLVLKTGLNIVVACNIPKNNPMIEANAGKKLIEKLISMGYSRMKPGFPRPELPSS
ncbi:uncharacterized protein LOC120202529 [Hibiscus syriacus]|uniref:uncharacterized protein LOC120202529 n=1 Tax=Hibiscus syriacus TaxID=106335 RepID=UPI001923346F|nr:uncharacterized protein LOC120202529 [Hibiscus syriacus]